MIKMKWIKLFEDFTTSLDIKKVVDAYLVAALWTEEERMKEDNDEDLRSMYGEPEEDDDEEDRSEHIRNLIPEIDFRIDNIGVDSKIKAYNDIKKFINIVGIDTINDNEIDEDILGHDIWLTRNRHGAGFFDRGYDTEVEEKLMKAAHELGEDYLYLGDDSLFHFEKE
jgi:hypothetical protein